jgi:hypothetical protein
MGEYSVVGVAVLIGLTQLSHGFEVPHAVNYVVHIVVAVAEREQRSRTRDTYENAKSCLGTPLCIAWEFSLLSRLIRDDTHKGDPRGRREKTHNHP